MEVEGPDVTTRCFRFDPEANPVNTVSRIRSSRRGLLVQGASSRVVSNELCAEMLVAQTLKAASTGRLLARKPEMDLLLRLAGTTQIERAIESAGAKPGEPFVVIVSGGADAVAALSRGRGLARVNRRKLSDDDYDQIEKAALLNAIRA